MKNILTWFSRKIDYPLLPPEIIQIPLTFRCNLRCKMCNLANMVPEEEELTTEQVLRIIDEASAYGIKELHLPGGEPFLREDIFEICKYSHGRGLKNVIITNGTLIDNSIAEAVSKLQSTHIHISFSGLEESTDFFRGPGVFKKIINAIMILNEKRKNNKSLSVGASCTVMDRNIHELSALVRLVDGLNLNVINFQALINNNASIADKCVSEFWVKKEQIPILEKEIANIRQYKAKHVFIYNEPRLELLVKYYQGELIGKDWVCFDGFKTLFINFSKNEPSACTCHGKCGTLSNASLKRAWTSREAHKLRILSKGCKDLCIQSCCSYESLQDLHKLMRFYLKRKIT